MSVHTFQRVLSEMEIPLVRDGMTHGPHLQDMWVRKAGKNVSAG